MKPETLEMLVIDRASGELSPEAGDLLADYLSCEPGWQIEARRIEETLGLAKQALAVTEAPALPAWNVERLPLFSASQSVRRWGLPNWTYGMAACFVAGLGLGWLANRPLPPPAFASGSRYSPAQAQTAPAAGAFWSRQHWRPTATPATLSRSAELIWKSPVRKPELKTTL